MHTGKGDAGVVWHSMLTETVVAVSIEVLVIVIVVLTLLKKPSFPLSSFSITLDSVSTEEARSEAARSPIASSCGDLGERERRRRFPWQFVTTPAASAPGDPCRHVDQRVTTCVDMKTKVRVPRLKSNLASSPPLTEN